MVSKGDAVMAERFLSERNLKFLLHEVFDAQEICRFPEFSKHTPKIFDMIVDAAVKLAKDLYKPYLEEMDKQASVLENGRVKVHPVVKKIMKEAGDGGWIGLRFAEQDGGENLPVLIGGACEFVFAAANYSASVYTHLTAGAANLIISFGTPGMQETYVPKMLEGKWQGTMALTEPQAGSSLSDIATTAVPTDEGFYKICGQKIFISAGDHDGVENIIHLLLARIEGAPAGVKGISLFVVPRLRPEKDHTLVQNDVQVTQIYHKLGYRGSPITELSFGEKGDCRGYLVGEPNNGLKCMFKMMNEARIGVGMGACGIASAAYYASCEYAISRPQGRKIGGKDPDRPPVPIIEHADVKRMLLFQRSIVEGSLSLLLQCALYADMEKAGPVADREKARLLLEILTPVAKTYPSEMGILSTSQGIQCLGGYGYCEDFPLEQFFRDSRIHPIHEGTTGIQGMDLLGRKIIMEEGKAFAAYRTEVRKTIDAASSFKETNPYAEKLENALKRLENVTAGLLAVAQKHGAETFLSDATLYLEFFGIVSVAWQWLKQGVAIKQALDVARKKKEVWFYQGKMFTLKYFFEYELPKIEGLAMRLESDDHLTVDMAVEYFGD